MLLHHFTIKLADQSYTILDLATMHKPTPSDPHHYHDKYQQALLFTTQVLEQLQIGFKNLYKHQPPEMHCPLYQSQPYFKQCTDLQLEAVLSLHAQLLHDSTYTQLQLEGHTGSGKTRVVCAALMAHLYTLNNTPPPPWMKHRQINLCIIACPTIKVVTQWHVAINTAIAESTGSNPNNSSSSSSTMVFMLYNH
jgi:hypothetical protein